MLINIPIHFLLITYPNISRVVTMITIWYFASFFLIGMLLHYQLCHCSNLNHFFSLTLCS